MKLNQVIAIEKGQKELAMRSVTDQYHTGQKADPFNGFTKVYTPKKEEDDKFPPESKIVQANIKEVLRQIKRQLVELFDVTATKDYANCNAKSDIKVDGELLVKDAPVTYILFLQQMLTHIRTIVEKLPILSSDEKWAYDEASSVWKTESIKTIKTAKVQEPLVLLQPTKEHPGQAQVITKDVTIGTWDTIKISGAMPPHVKESLLERIERLQRAVKEAREEANMIDAPSQEIGAKIFDWLYHGIAGGPRLDIG